MLDKMKKAFNELTQGAEIMRQSAADLRARLGALAQEKRELLELPVTSDDFARIICSWIDQRADGEKDAFIDFFRGQALGEARGFGNGKWGTATVDNMRRLPTQERYLHGLLTHGTATLGEIKQEPALFLFREPIKKAIIEAIQAMDWPYVDAPPLSETLARIDAIDAEVEILLAEEAALQSKANQIGIDIKPRAAPPIVATDDSNE